MVTEEAYLGTGVVVALHDKDEAFVAISGNQRRFGLGTQNIITLTSQRVAA